MFKNKFKLPLIASAFVVVGMVGAGQAQAGSLSAESLDKSHPCYEHVYRMAVEDNVQEMREMEEREGIPAEEMALSEELQKEDHQLSYLYVFFKEYRKGRSAKEIRQTILDKCISNKKL